MGVVMPGIIFSRSRLSISLSREIQGKLVGKTATVRVTRVSERSYDLVKQAREVGEALSSRGWMLVTAESCTGGWVAQAVTAIAGSSGWFERGFVTYSNIAKQELLGVQQSDLDTHGAVSDAVVRQMAIGALARGHGHISVAVSGIAGPGGALPGKPVGTVWLAWATATGQLRSQQEQFEGDRAEIRRRAVNAALAGVLESLAREAR